jgi:hypothetical protein
MLKFLETRSSVISENIFIDKFTNKKILIMGSGPSVNCVNWENLHVDGIVTTSFFYLNDKIRNLSNIVHITLTDLVDLEHPNLIEFIEKNINCTIAFEPKYHPFYESIKYKKFNDIYKDRIIYYNTQYGKKEGVAGRLCYFIMQFSPAELYYIGIDGKSNNSNKDPYNAFRINIQGDADNYPYEEFVESHINMAKTLYEYSLHNNCKLYNLGEGFEFNCSTTYSKQYFPLNEEIKQKIKL